VIFLKNYHVIPILLLFMISALALAGCEKVPEPQNRFSEYISLWNKQKFTNMYQYLSADAKKSVSEKEFTDRYQKIYKDLEISGLKVSFKKPKEEKREKPVYSFSVKMNSVAGAINFTGKAHMQKQERNKKTNWYIDWDPSFIFPKMQAGDKISIQTEEPARGEILDRNGNGLAINGQVYEVGVIAGQVSEAAIQQLSSLLGMPQVSINQALAAGWVKDGLFVPLKNVSMDNTALVDKLVALDAVRTKKVNARIYPYKEAAAHLTGYVGPITADELKDHPDYSSQDIIGKRGLEQVFDEQLHGKTGVRILITKKLGGVEVLAEKPVEDGKQVQLTIDVAMQEKLFGELKGEAGTAAAMNPQTGETLALVSSPSFDPNQAALGFSAAQLKALQDNKLSPLTTRFKQGYAPGSVLKPIVAAIGLTNGSLNPSAEVAISGKKWQKGKSWGNYYVTRVHVTSPVNLEKSLIYSDNIYFAQTALKMGATAFTEGLQKFAFGEDWGYAYPLVKSSIGSLSSEIALADSGYGQGQVQVNIVHLMASYSVFANNGNMIKPVLLVDEPQKQVLKEQVVSPEAAATVTADMRKVVSDPHGTAHTAEIPGYPLAGKTGTAEIKQKQGELGTENGWFVAFNPETPNLMIAMMVEGVEKKGGSMVPVKKVTDIFKAYKK
jgi:cell division protein FtsI/penicillin-binding protein 2